MVRFHQEHGGLVTLFTHPNNHPYDSGLIIAEKDMSVQSWLAKEDVRPTYYKNRVNAGLHVIDPKVLDMVSIDPQFIHVLIPPCLFDYVAHSSATLYIFD